MYQIKADFLCICGHPYDHHERISNFTGDEPTEDEDNWCATDEDLSCECQEFVPDNLRYLEKLSE